MILAPGSRLGPYEIVAPIGAGGMGEVYRATDTKLKRQVAIKVLPPSLAGDRERLARFQREAELLASLNHPHIAGIYGLEESAGVSALVMELVDGEDLSRRIARGARPGNRSSRSQAREYHRARGRHGKGSRLRPRKNIWAFGVILYEMVTGRPLFAGETVVETLAAVVTKKPDLSLAPAVVRPSCRPTGHRLPLAERRGGRTPARPQSTTHAVTLAADNPQPAASRPEKLQPDEMTALAHDLS